jgi:hypothetical protein
VLKNGNPAQPHELELCSNQGHNIDSIHKHEPSPASIPEPAATAPSPEVVRRPGVPLAHVVVPLGLAHPRSLRHQAPLGGRDDGHQGLRAQLAVRDLGLRALDSLMRRGRHRKMKMKKSRVPPQRESMSNTIQLLLGLVPKKKQEILVIDIMIVYKALRKSRGLIDVQTC